MGGEAFAAKGILSKHLERRREGTGVRGGRESSEEGKRTCKGPEVGNAHVWTG